MEVKKIADETETGTCGHSRDGGDGGLLVARSTCQHASLKKLKRSARVVWRFLHFDHTRTHRVKENIGILDCILIFYLSLSIGVGGGVFAFYFGVLSIIPYAAFIAYVMLLTLNKLVDVKA